MSLPASNEAQDRMVFKGLKNGLMLILPTNGTFHACYQELSNRLDEAKDFFRGAHVMVETKGRALSNEERRLLGELFLKHGVTMKLDSEIEATVQEKEKNPFVPTLMIHRTLRSGQRAEFDGNVVIKGDVNPGAEIIASGDIVILGALRGIAHAGAKGDATSEVIAFAFEPVQLRIAGYIARPPEETARTRRPEIARVHGETIVVEDYF
ncbi:MAG TPA: septum site-determining protein MinC [Bacillota bacterium]|nr:septum site-determining protein MinC [Bacillota bacterium]